MNFVYFFVIKICVTLRSNCYILMNFTFLIYNNMLKKICSLSCMAAMLLTTACSSDEDVATTIGGESEVTFAVQLPADVQARSRAEYGDGQTALNLVWQVYDEAGNKLNAHGEATFTNRVATVTMRLANSRKYNVLFWASASGCPYTFDANTKTVTFNKDGVTAQDERHDAFYAHYTTPTAVSGSLNETVNLYRPFAQINIGATDATQAAAAGWVTDQTRVTVSNVYTKLNLYDGTVSDPIQVVYDYANQPDDNTYSFPLTVGADYQAMVYTLTGSEGELVNVKFEAKDGSQIITREYANVPVRRNYQTNIYGNILTEEANFTVEIVPGFHVSYDYLPAPGTAMVNGVQYATLQDAVNAASGTEVEVTVGAGSYTMPTIPAGKEVILKGQGADVTTIAMPNVIAHFTNMTIAHATLELGQTNNAFFGVQHTPNVTLDGARVVGLISTYASNFMAVNTTFVSGDGYCVHIYGAGTATFENCKFESTSGKAVYCHDEGSVPVHHDIIFTDCTFNSSVAITNAENPLKSKAPVQLHTELTSCGTLTMTRCTATGFGDPHGNGDLWNEIHNADPVHATTKFTVTINGTVVQTAN